MDDDAARSKPRFVVKQLNQNISAELEGWIPSQPGHISPFRVIVKLMPAEIAKLNFLYQEIADRVEMEFRKNI